MNNQRPHGIHLLSDCLFLTPSAARLFQSVPPVVQVAEPAQAAANAPHKQNGVLSHADLLRPAADPVLGKVKTQHFRSSAPQPSAPLRLRPAPPLVEVCPPAPNAPPKVRAKTAALPRHVQAIAQGNAAANASLHTLIAEGVQVDVLLADPPWNYNGRTNNGNRTSHCPSHHYPTMSTADICAMPIKRLVARDAVLYLWVPNFLLLQGIRVMEAWGFRYANNRVWTKSTSLPSTGPIVSTHEMLLVGYRGRGIRIPNGVTRMRSSFATVGRPVHSAKPSHFGDEIDRLYPTQKKMELFCRTPRQDWIAHGNQVNGGQGIAAVAPSMKGVV